MNKIVIVIPCYNEMRNIELTLSKILLQIFKYKEFSFQLIVLDDCSTDASLAIIKNIKNNTFKDLQILINKSNVGIAISTKILLLNALKLNPDFVLKCDMDNDIPHAEVIEYFISYLKNHKISHNHIIVGERNIKVDKNNMSTLEISEKNKMITYLSTILNIYNYNPVSSGTLFYGKEVLRSILKQKVVNDYNLRWGLDFLLPLIALKQGFTVDTIKIDNGSYSIDRRNDAKIKAQYNSYYHVLDLLKNNYILNI